MNRFLYIGLFFLSLSILSCKQHKDKPITQKYKIVQLDRVDLYPQFPGCNNNFEKTAQLSCFQKKFSLFLSYSLKNHYQKELQLFKDTAWVSFNIDTIGKIHFLRLKLSSDSLPKNSQIAIFKKITYLLPKVKPAIYRDYPVNFKFEIPLLFN